MEKRTLSVGDHVWFYDSKGQRRNALVLAIWGEIDYPEVGNNPCINVVIVCDDEDRQDGLGRQTYKESSVQYGHEHCAHGNYWHFLDDTPIPYRKPAQV